MITLAQARRNKSLTQRELADKLEIQHTKVASWERGVLKPGPADRKKLCEILEIAWEEIELIPEPEKAATSREERIQQTQAYEEWGTLILPGSEVDATI